MKRLGSILDDNKIPYDKKVLATLIEKHFPDFRKTINELQRYSVNVRLIVVYSLIKKSRY
ncbi:MAG: hypothetical protein CM15mV8_1300 [Caudoviricetes sp.]|nr:MAG: hypothetical protein CM15mV8_1300 [Caudoviricetes sp.]